MVKRDLPSGEAGWMVVHFMLDQRKPFGFPYLCKGPAIKGSGGKGLENVGVTDYLYLLATGEQGYFEAGKSAFTPFVGYLRRSGRHTGLELG
jgi:hypothetical protein